MAHSVLLKGVCACVCVCAHARFFSVASIKGDLSHSLLVSFACKWALEITLSGPLSPYMICFACLLLKDGALLGGEASYLAKIPLSFSLLGHNPLSMYYIMLIFVL